MQKADLAHLFDYMYWVNTRLLEAADGLPPDRFVEESKVTTRDLRATLVHELDVEWSWRLALQGRSAELEAADDLEPLDYPDVATLREHWRRDEAEMRAWLGGLREEDVAADVRPALSRSARPMWQFLLHIVIHATQQQADAATLLTFAGRSPGDLGYPEWLASRRESPRGS